MPVPIPGAELLQTLQFHIALPILGLAVLLFLARARWRALLVALVTLVSLAEGGLDIVRQQMGRNAIAGEPTVATLRLMSLNVLYSNTDNGARVAEAIVASGADVVMTMESGPLFPYLATLAERYPYRVGCTEEDTCDLMLMSRLPLDEVLVRGLSRLSNDRLIMATVVLDGTPITIAATHLTKPYFDQFAYIEILQLRSRLKTRPGPLVIAGDFNAAPWSENIVSLTMSEKLYPGPWYPATWPVALGPLGVPIDNVFARAPLVVESIEAISDPLGSNHRGLMATLALKQPAGKD